MVFKLEVLPAQEGDCLLLHWSDGDGKQRIAVIDGGPGQVFESTLRPRLHQLAADRKPATLPIDLVMVSHVDNDHVVGIKKLFAELRSEVEKNVPSGQRVLTVDRLWHNTFNDIMGDATNAYYDKLTASFTAAAKGEPDPQLEQDLQAVFEKQQELSREEAEHAAAEIAAILAGHGESSALRDDHEFLRKKGAIRFQLNSPFKSNAGQPTLLMGPDQKPAQVEGLHIAVYGPLQAELEALQKAHDAFVKKNGPSVEAALAAYADDSVPNLSSIVVLLGAEDNETGSRRTILFTGDARGDKILDGLRAGGVLKDAPIFVDVLKVPHHGSNRNLEPDFFDQIVAGVYILSADGKHGNPDRETLEWIVDSRRKADRYEIVLTYPLAQIDATRKKVFEREQLRKKEANREVWSDKKHSLASFFAAKEQEGYAFKLTIGDGKRPIPVELGKA